MFLLDRYVVFCSGVCRECGDYKLDNFKAHVWLAHQRYPTRGRVWHPGGCHPFSALNEALVHNGDFAKYQSIYEYLKQRTYQPLFLTDTEEAALLLDLWSRVYKYPLEHLIEAMAPTSEMDFDMLSPEKQEIYKAIQTHHVGASPDGPWFFIIARNDVRDGQFQLIGITDTAMLRPQVFALQEGEVQVGLICSEKQAIDATLISLVREDARFRPIADKYWNARGGSYTDGGSFIFSLKDSGDASGNKKLVCTDKFGRVIETPQDKEICDIAQPIESNEACEAIMKELQAFFAEKDPATATRKIVAYIQENIGRFDANSLRFAVDTIKKHADANNDCKQIAIDSLTLLSDLRYNTGKIKRSSVQHVIKLALDAIFDETTMVTGKSNSRFSRIDFATRGEIRAPQKNEKILVIDAEAFEPEGDLCDAVLIVKAYQLGWKRFIVYKYRGQRFTGCGLGPATQGVRIDVYGSSGDYLASGIDGMEIYVHGNAQDLPDYERRQAGGLRRCRPDLHVRCQRWHRLYHGQCRRTVGSNHVHVIDILPSGVVTGKGIADVTRNAQGEFVYDSQQDIVKVAVAERHQNTGNVAVALLRGYGIKAGAVALSIAHDSHNIIVVGTNDEDMTYAVEQLIAQGGGIILVKDNNIIDSMPMVVGGIMSDRTGEWVSDELKEIHEAAYTQLGISREVEPVMTLCFMSLPVIPELKLTDMGLFDVTKFAFIPLEAS